MKMKNIEFDTIKATTGILANISEEWNRALKSVDAKEKISFFEDMNPLYVQLKSSKIDLIGFSNNFFEILKKYPALSEFCVKELDWLERDRHSARAGDLIDVSKEEFIIYKQDIYRSVEEIKEEIKKMTNSGQED